MLKTILGLIISLAFLPSFSQDSQSGIVKDPIYMIVQEMPLFYGAKDDKESLEKLQKFISKKAIEAYVLERGIVYVTFVVNQEGSVADVAVIKGVSEEMDEAAIAIVKEMKPWTPGTQNGKKAKVRYNIPVHFK